MVQAAVFILKLERLKEVMRPKLEEAIDVLRHLNDELDIDEEV